CRYRCYRALPPPQGDARVQRHARHRPQRIARRRTFGPRHECRRESVHEEALHPRRSPPLLLPTRDRSRLSTRRLPAAAPPRIADHVSKRIASTVLIVEAASATPPAGRGAPTPSAGLALRSRPSTIAMIPRIMV